MEQDKTEQKLLYVWLDKPSIQSEDYTDTQEQIKNTIKDFRTYKGSDECLDFITDLTDVNVIFITSYRFAKILIPSIHSCEQIHSFYIFYSGKSLDEQWTKDYHKIKGLFRDTKLIYDQLMKDTTKQTQITTQPNTTIQGTNEQENERIGISFLSSVDINSNDINRQDPTFMYFQLLKDILLQYYFEESEEQTKTEMISYCRSVCSDNPTAVVDLDDFEETFIPELSILWYTKETFLHKMLNKALWTPEPDVLYKLRYFLRHLYSQIVAHGKAQRNQLTSMTVYRGQSVSADQLEKLRRNVGGFLSFNNFLSTSMKKDVALNFLMGAEIGVLFEMDIDINIQKFPMVNIELIPFLQKEDSEQEILFATGSVFRILRIGKQNDLYHVYLALSDDVDQQLAEYTKRTRAKTRTFHSFLSLLKLMNELSEYSSVDKFAEILRDDIGLSANPSILASIHHMFGLIYLSRKQLEKSSHHSQKSLAINLESLPADDPTLTATYNNIGCVYSAQGNYEKAYEYQKLALDCELKSKYPTPSLIILYTINIAKIYDHQDKYKEALEYYKRALELQKQHLGENDPALAKTYSRIRSVCLKIEDYGQAVLYSEQANTLEETTCQLDPEAAADSSIRNGDMCMSQKEYQEALYHYNRALEIQQQYLLPNNPSLATTYNHIAGAYHKYKMFEESIPHYKKALEIELSSLSSDNPAIATSYYNISTAYVSLSRWADALEYGQKAAEQAKKYLQNDIDTVASFIHHLGHIYQEQKQYEQALIYYEEALELYHTYAREDDPTLFILYHRAAKVYYELNKYDRALVFYQKVLNIELKILADDAKEIGTGYWNIASAYLGLKRFDEASLATEKAIDQFLKTLPYNHREVVQCRVYLDHIKQTQISKMGYS